MLERFRKAKEGELAALRERAAKGSLPRPFAGERPSFVGSLKTRAPLAVIAEYKRASPSRGDINLGIEPEQAAAVYTRAGAGALSVLTERDCFKGDMAYLERMAGPGLPLLRKDFILHPLQLDQTAASPASAVLLIARMLDDAMLRVLLFRSLDMGLEPVVEVFDAQDLRRARAAGAPIIQVNNRDLDTLRVSLSLSRRLAAFKRGNEFWITASGIRSREELRGLLDLGYDAALIGSSLMDNSDPGQGLSALLRGGEAHA
ncbi:MAG: indole-3-glycerol-phosphate synthase [Deltaproteobacteria bacterium]|jgi:indole-3-glycerol phosphate synthase|nr:indole-3-glycerol-phosphate synthase [Deltaproteobacteria bacterium]